jgi:hypothetical protein
MARLHELIGAHLAGAGQEEVAARIDTGRGCGPL